MAERPLTRVLIANRGEIARRIIRTCSRLGLESVAVYTDPDAHAPFVREATVAISLGSPDSYLSAEKIIKAAKESGAGAIHPGYGFLSENAAFAEACERSGVTLIGPTSAAMRSLGSKTAAKQIAKEANVPAAPTLLFSQDPLLPRAEQLKAFADRIGYPVMLKAAAGGGGRGMRLVRTASEAEDQIESAEREALKAFGSSEVFAERCVSPARHIEVQVAADHHGGVVALGTRDCSLQRSNQKIIEEGPAIHLREGLEREMCQAACRLAKEAKYTGLGTVEFLCSPNGEFFFLEVNTRLQVEHPVTEMLTGLDLVELQIRIAEGAKLSELGLHDTPRQRGHAIEARLCAEEYSAGRFVLSTGVVQEFEIPTREFDGATVRLDAGVEPCSEISHYYDSLIAKVIVHAENRPKAIAALHEALSRSKISGVKTNRALLIHLLSHPSFAELSHTVQGTSDLLPTEDDQLQSFVRAHAIAAALRCIRALSVWAKGSPWLSAEGILAQQAPAPWTTMAGGCLISSLSSRSAEGALVDISAAGASFNVAVSLDDLAPQHPFGLRLRARTTLDPEPLGVSIVQDGPLTWVHTARGTVCLEEKHIRPGSLSATGPHSSAEITAHIPGKVAALQVAVGERVSAGQVLLVLDSMKMEHPIKCSVSGTVRELPATAGTVVQSGALLAVVEAD